MSITGQTSPNTAIFPRPPTQFESSRHPIRGMILRLGTFRQKQVCTRKRNTFRKTEHEHLVSPAGVPSSVRISGVYFGWRGKSAKCETMIKPQDRTDLPQSSQIEVPSVASFLSTQVTTCHHQDAVLAIAPVAIGQTGISDHAAALRLSCLSV